MENPEYNIDSRMDYQETNFDKIKSHDPYTISSNNNFENSSQFGAQVANIDLKTCDFDFLLSNLSKKVIIKNIRSIYHFLKGKRDEVEFRGANMYVEEILVRIVRNVDVLQSQKFNQHCMSICNLIIDILKNAISNRTFMVACVYKNEKDYVHGRAVYSKLLVYRKLYYSSDYESQMQFIDGMHSIASMSSTPPLSRSTSMDSLDSQRSNFDPKPPSANHFICHCLHLMLHFVKDDTQLRLEFSDLDKDNTVYIHSIISSVIDESFDNGTLGKRVCRALWEAVKIFRLKFEFRVRNLKSSLDLKSLLWEKRMKTRESDYTDVPRSNIKFKSGGVMNQRANGHSTILDCERHPVVTEMMKKYSTTDNKTIQPTECNMQQQSNPTVSGLPKTPAQQLKGFDGRNEKLMEALSVPVQIDKAVKIMRGMGWKGGALGARGNGIMEPIMPHLSTGLGAGLGHMNLKKLHIKVPKLLSVPLVLSGSNNKKTTAKFRASFLNNLLQLLLSSDDTATLRFFQVLNKKEYSFLRHLIRTFALRSKMKLEGDEQALVDAVEELIKKTPEMVVTACVSDDKRQIVLSKNCTLGLIYNSEVARNKKICITKSMMENIQEFMAHYGPLFYSNKTQEVTLFKVKYLMRILKLVKDKSLDYVVVDFDKTLSLQDKNVVCKSIVRLNKRNKLGDLSPEAILTTEIRRFMGCYTLSCNFNQDYTNATITKEYLKPSMIKGAGQYACVENRDDATDDKDIADIENVEKMNENKNDLNDKDKMSETEDNIRVDVDNPDSLMQDNVIYINYDEDMKQVENKTEKDKINTLSNQEIVEEKMENCDSTVKGETNDNTTNENDEIIKIDDDNEPKMNTESINEYSTDDMSLSDFTGVKANLDYNETNYSGTGDDKSVKLGCDKLDISLKSHTALNVNLDEQSATANKYDVKIVHLTNNNVFSKYTPTYIQGLISLNIIKTKQLPLLQCHGVHSNALIYSCHTEKSYDWLLGICNTNNIKIYTKEIDTMSLKINSFFDFNEKYLFNLLELYNKEMSTKEWSVLKKEKNFDSIVFNVRMDIKSAKFVLESNLALYAGVDKVNFSIIWE